MGGHHAGGATRGGGHGGRSWGALAAVAVAVVVVTGLVVAVLLVSGQHRDSPPAGPAAREPAPSGGGRPDRTTHADRPGLAAALEVLHRWDRRRAGAWLHGDVAALDGLYVPGSPAGRRDVAMLRSWARRGVLPATMSTQVLAAELRRTGARRIRLLVTDRVVVTVGTPSERRGGVRPLPRDAPSTRLVVLRRDDPARAPRPRWRVAAVYDRPAATTADTSGSANS